MTMTHVINHWRVNRYGRDVLWLIVGIGVLIRLVFMGLLNLLPEEAYYWNYARHLDFGYLDHPPMVAWLIHMSEAVLGKSEFAVRLPAFLGWLGLAWFMYRFTVNTAGKREAGIVLVLLAVLPIYMSVGFLMTPDAPFYLCWAAALYFLERAILGGRSHAWYPAGIALGLGLLSKYTMGLVVPATLLFLVWDRQSRHWLHKPQPYLGLLIGLLLFLPVIYWNATREWVSFAFQGSARWSVGVDFHLHILIGSVLVLLTPLGAFEAVRALTGFRRKHDSGRDPDHPSHRVSTFMVVFAVVPLAIFVVHSIQGQPKLNWTGPVWLALLPLIATNIQKLKPGGNGSLRLSLLRPWIITTTCLCFLYAGGFLYLIEGMPGVGKGDRMAFPVAWSDYGDRIERIETELEAKTGSEPLVVGLDQYWLASEASFYDYDMEDSDTLPEVAAESLVGGNSLMWNFWVPPGTASGRNALLVSFTVDKLTNPSITGHFSQLGEIHKEELRDCNGVIGKFFWRAGYAYNLERQAPGENSSISLMERSNN